MKQSEMCQIQTENCTCVNRGSSVQMDCLKDRLSYEIDLDFGQFKIGPSKKSINLTIKNMLINQIKLFANESDDFRMIVSLRIEDCKMKELKTNSFEKMNSFKDSFKNLELNLKTLEIVSKRIKIIKETDFFNYRNFF